MKQELAVKVSQLSKIYYKRTLSEGSLVAKMGSFFKNILDRTLLVSKKREPFYALKNINLEIEKGQVLGIIGNNGAGKSTLLKLMSAITPPTKGTIEIFGRIAPMLEIGSGFHEELSGRDNVFLNGAIMGMKRTEIAAHFDEILAFSGLSSFIDTPLKHYSSGMKIRLAFSIAAFLQPEILLVDEILAVGDVYFQRKCLAKMEEKAKEGITILFVSHDLDAVRRLCTHCVYLEKGTVKNIGITNAIIEQYLEDQAGNIQEGYHVKRQCPKETVSIEDAYLPRHRNKYLISEEIPLEITIHIKTKLKHDIQIWMDFLDRDGKVFLKSCTGYKKELTGNNQHLLVKLILPAWLITPGHYSFRLSAWHPHNWEKLCEINNILPIHVLNELEQVGNDEDSKTIDCNWEIKKVKKLAINNYELIQ